jgi:hypothetical protein
MRNAILRNTGKCESFWDVCGGDIDAFTSELTADQNKEVLPKM